VRAGRLDGDVAELSELHAPGLLITSPPLSPTSPGAFFADDTLLPGRVTSHGTTVRKLRDDRTRRKLRSKKKQNRKKKKKKKRRRD